MRTTHLISLALVCTIVLLCGCGSNAQRPKGVIYDLPQMPAAESFSETEYEDYSEQFPPVSSAVYYHNGISEPIAVDDPRLIRLLNAIAFSWENRWTAYLTCVIEEDEICKRLRSNAQMLEIFFDTSNIELKALNHSKTPRVLVCGDTYLLFLNTDSPESGWHGQLTAEQYYPYHSLVFEHISDEQAEADGFYSSHWGGHVWLDLLVYAGFAD